MVHLADEEVRSWQVAVLDLEREGMVTRTFRRLDPVRQLAVIDAILEDAAEHGPERVSVRRVAEGAGVAVGSLYQYFPRREGMLTFASTLAVRFLVGSLMEYREALAALPLRDALVAYTTGGLEWSRARLGLLRFFARAAYHGDAGYRDTVVVPVAAAIRDLLRAILEAAQRRGELRPDIDLDDAIRFCHALTVPIADAELLPHLDAYFGIYQGDRPPVEVRAALVDFLVRALRPAESQA